MMKLTAFLCLAMVLLFSCSKEKSFEGETTNNNGSTDSLLVRMVQKAGPDSITYSYAYDASRRLISQTYFSSLQGVTNNEQITVKRSAQGVIQQVIQNGDLFSVNGINNLVFNVHYDASTSRYTSKVFTFQDAGITVIDSIVYTYNGAGKIIRAEDFYGAPQYNQFTEGGKTEFTYSGSNINNAKTFDYDTTTGAYHLSYEQTFEYDANVNPLSLGVEAIVLSYPTYFTNNHAALFAVNNITKDTYTDYDNSANNDVISFIYMYNTLKKPDLGTGTYKGNRGSYAITYYYQ